VLVAVCGTSSRLTQETLVPAGTVSVRGLKRKLSITTWLGSAGDVFLPAPPGSIGVVVVFCFHTGCIVAPSSRFVSPAAPHPTRSAADRARSITWGAARKKGKRIFPHGWEWNLAMQSLLFGNVEGDGRVPSPSAT